MKRILTFLLPVFLFATPAQVILMRHAEKPSSGDSLSLKGRERAMALVPFFYGNPSVLNFGLPTAVYTSQAATHQTVKPLTETMKAALIDRFKQSQIEAMANDLLSNPDYEGKMVLVCWPHEELPKIASLLGAKKPPKTWADNTYDRLWILNYDDEGNAAFKDVPQKLLYGDSPK